MQCWRRCKQALLASVASTNTFSVCDSCRHLLQHRRMTEILLEHATDTRFPHRPLSAVAKYRCGTWVLSSASNWYIIWNFLHLGVHTCLWLFLSMNHSDCPVCETLSGKTEPNISIICAKFGYSSVHLEMEETCLDWQLWGSEVNKIGFVHIFVEDNRYGKKHGQDMHGVSQPDTKRQSHWYHHIFPLLPQKFDNDYSFLFINDCHAL